MGTKALRSGLAGWELQPGFPEGFSGWLGDQVNPDDECPCEAVVLGEPNSSEGNPTNGVNREGLQPPAGFGLGTHGLRLRRTHVQLALGFPGGDLLEGRVVSLGGFNGLQCLGVGAGQPSAHDEDYYQRFHDAGDTSTNRPECQGLYRLGESFLRASSGRMAHFLRMGERGTPSASTTSSFV